MGSCSSVPDTHGSKLHVILPISNPLNFRIREQRFQECLKKLQRVANINILVVRLNYENDILLKVNDKKTHIELVLSTTRENILWSKENLINIGINYIKHKIIGYEINEENKKLVYAETFIAWIDADIDFMSRSWVADAINELRLLETKGGGFIQLFSQANFLGPKNEIIRTLNSFCYQRSLGKTYCEVSNVNHDYWHPGFAWASTLNTLIKFNKSNNNNNIQKDEDENYYLIDKTIGGADRHMAMSFLGQADQTVPKEISQEYRQVILDWQSIALHYEMKTSYISGIINHYWHGDLLNRKYVERWEILAKNNFIPDDLIYRSGDKLLVYRNNEKTELQKGIYQYFLDRNEDSNIVIGNNNNYNTNINMDVGRGNNYNNHNDDYYYSPPTTNTDNHYPVYQGGKYHDNGNRGGGRSNQHHHHSNNYNDSGNSSTWQGYG